MALALFADAPKPNATNRSALGADPKIPTGTTDQYRWHGKKHLTPKGKTVTKIFVAGDWHGSIWHAKYCLEQAAEFDCDIILQVGDFGYWEHTPGGVKFLEWLDRFAKQYEIPVLWIDGNHENHPLLWDTYRDQKDENGFYVMRDWISYIPRGTVWKWDGVRFMGLGGAFSIDRNWRRVGSSFWFEETLTDEDVALACENGKDKVDVMFAHDVLTGVDINGIFARQGKSLMKSRESDLNRDRVREVVEAVEPRFLYHGHYHHAYKEKVIMHYGPLQVEGLNCDGSEQQSFTVIDTADILDKGRAA